MLQPPSDVVDVWYLGDRTASGRGSDWGRSAVRAILAGYLDVLPDEIPFDVSPHGKPFVRGSDLEFSLSHCTGGTACAVTRGRPVGVDIEQAAEVPALEQLLYVCSERERAQLSRCAPARRSAAFLRLWTRKEATIKALGTGFLGCAPEQVEALNPQVGLGGRTFRLIDVDLPNHLCALACAGIAAFETRVFTRDGGPAKYRGLSALSSGRSAREEHG